MLYGQYLGGICDWSFYIIMDKKDVKRFHQKIRLSLCAFIVKTGIRISNLK